MFFHSNSVRQTKILFVTVAQWHKSKLFLLQWLCALNNSEKIIQFLCFVLQWNEEEKNQQKNIHPNLNFTSAIKLLLVTFKPIVTVKNWPCILCYDLKNSGFIFADSISWQWVILQNLNYINARGKIVLARSSVCRSWYNN